MTVSAPPIVLINLRQMLVLQRAVTFSIAMALLAPLLAAKPTAEENDVQIRLLTQDVPGGGKEYAARLTNNGKEPISFQALPDRGFPHSSCTYGSIFATSISRWNDVTQHWEPIDTFIDGLKASVKGDFAANTVTLKSGRSLCAGWWADTNVAKEGERLRMTVCTSFQAKSRCFTSPPFLMSTKPRDTTHDRRGSARHLPVEHPKQSVEWNVTLDN